MERKIKNQPLFKKILKVDLLLGYFVAAVMLLFYKKTIALLGTPLNLHFTIAFITCTYAVFASILAMPKNTPINALTILVIGNFVWALACIVMLFLFFNVLTLLGIIFLLLNIIVVLVLAILEGAQIARK